MPPARQRKLADGLRCSCTQRADIVVLDDLGCTPVVVGRELDAIERYLGDALAKLFREDTDEGDGHGKQAPAVPLS